MYECVYNKAIDALVGQWFYWEYSKSDRWPNFDHHSGICEIVGSRAHLYQSARLETHGRDSQRGETLNLYGEQQRMFVMGSAIALRDDYDGSVLRRLARSAKDAG